MAQQSPILEIEDVEISLGGRPILRGVGLQVRPGEVVGLVGRNGVGKTTLLRIASGALRPERGRVALLGCRLEKLSRRQLAKTVATVSQDLHVPFPFLAGEMVLMGRAPHQGLLGFESAEDLRLARDAMARLGIGSFANRSILELSGGERQLVMFARAVVQEASLLLLDEPTAFLDLRHRIDVLRVVRELAEQGRGALVVSHDLGLASRICDRVVVLCDGEALAEGSPQEVLRPDVLLRAFGIHADIVPGPDGEPLVVPRLSD